VSSNALENLQRLEAELVTVLCSCFSS